MHAQTLPSQSDFYLTGNINDMLLLAELFGKSMQVKLADDKLRPNYFTTI